MNRCPRQRTADEDRSRDGPRSREKKPSDGHPAVHILKQQVRPAVASRWSPPPSPSARSPTFAAASRPDPAAGPPARIGVRGVPWERRAITGARDPCYLRVRRRARAFNGRGRGVGTLERRAGRRGHRGASEPPGTRACLEGALQEARRGPPGSRTVREQGARSATVPSRVG